MLEHRPASVADADGTLANGIFISYRRDDTSGHVIALMEPLSARFGEERIFKDTDSIPAGRDFVEEVKQQLASCAVVLVVIGREWLTISQPRHTGRRLDDPNDLVRLEVSTALATPGVLVIPVLVDRAAMPAPEDLPVDLQALSRRNYIELTDTRWRTDTEHLLHRIEQTMPVSGIRLWWRKVSEYSVHLLLAVIVALTGALAITSDWSRWFASPRGDNGGATTAPPAVARDEKTRPADSSAKQPPAPDRNPAAPDPKVAAPDPKTPDTPIADPGGNAPITAPRGGTARGTTPRTPDPETKPHQQPAPQPPAAVNRPVGGGGHQDPAKDRAAILDVLERFRQAFIRKDKQVLREVYPGARVDDLVRDQCAQRDLVFAQPQVVFTPPDSARVEVEAGYGCTPTTRQSKIVSTVTDAYFFARQSGVWVIEKRTQYVSVDRKQ